MPHQLNPNIETLILLANTPWGEKSKAQAIEELDATGVDGQAFYSRNFGIVERYYAAFEKGRVESPGAALLAEADTAVMSLYMDVVWHHPAWVENGIDAVADETLAAAVKSQITEEDGEDVVAAVESLGVADESKWRVMLLVQKPRQQLGAVFSAVRENLPAFEKAQAAVAGEMAGLLEQFDKLAEGTYGSWPLDLTRVLSSSAPIIPTLAMSCAVLITDDVCVCGLLCYKLFRSVSGELTKEELLVCAKALSDKSKVEILLCLKEDSLYGLELAEKVGLTPATVSHHMGILLATGFVELEKKGGKAYYRLSKTGVQKFLSGTGQLLL